MLTVFFSHEGIIHHEYTPDGHNINNSTLSKFSAGRMMQCCASDLCRGREVTGSCTMQMLLPTHPTLFRTSWLNIRSHKCCCPLFTNMALCDSFLFPQMKMLLKGNRFQDMDEIKQNMMTQLLAFPKRLFQKCFRQWKDHWNKCVVSEGDWGNFCLAKYTLKQTE
jgi:hypothetical protein